MFGPSRAIDLLSMIISLDDQREPYVVAGERNIQGHVDEDRVGIVRVLLVFEIEGADELHLAQRLDAGRQVCLAL